MDNIIVFYDAQNFNKTEDYDAARAVIEKYGNISLVRVYQHFTKHKKWLDFCFDRGLQPCQLTPPKKNTADLLITVDAMKLSRTNTSDIYCFVSNDSDFCPASIALRECGVRTMIITLKEIKDLKGYFTFYDTLEQPKPERWDNKNKPNNDRKTDFVDNKANANDNRGNNQDFKPKTQDFKPAVVEEKPAQMEEKPKPTVEVKPQLRKEDVVKELTKIFAKLKVDADGNASYATFCMHYGKRFPDCKDKIFGVKKKEFFESLGYQVNGLVVKKPIN